MLMKHLKKLPTKFVTCILFFSAPPSFASNCKSAITQREMNACASSALDRETKKINNVYGDLRAKLDEKQKSKLKEIQLAWIKFRDLECKFTASGVEGGSAYPMVHDACLAEMTQQRIKQLSRFLNCEEGDLSCPVTR